jgi:hypothetical protein
VILLIPISVAKAPMKSPRARPPRFGLACPWGLAVFGYFRLIVLVDSLRKLAAL